MGGSFCGWSVHLSVLYIFQMNVKGITCNGVPMVKREQHRSAHASPLHSSVPSHFRSSYLRLDTERYLYIKKHIIDYVKMDNIVRVEELDCILVKNEFDEG